MTKPGSRATDDPRRRFGARLATVRRNRGWTQEQLANHSGINRTYISGLENGERNIGLLNLVRLAEALDVAAAELLHWDASSLDVADAALLPWGEGSLDVAGSGPGDGGEAQ